MVSLMPARVMRSGPKLAPWGGWAGGMRQCGRHHLEDSQAALRHMRLSPGTGQLHRAVLTEPGSHNPPGSADTLGRYLFRLLPLTACSQPYTV